MNHMTSLFDSEICSTDKYYVFLRDDQNFRTYRDLVEDLWRRYEPCADRHFREQTACEVTVDRASDKVVSQGYEYRPQIVKKKGESLPDSS